MEKGEGGDRALGRRKGVAKPLVCGSSTCTEVGEVEGSLRGGEDSYRPVTVILQAVGVMKVFNQGSGLISFLNYKMLFASRGGIGRKGGGGALGVRPARGVSVLDQQ